MHKQVAKEKQEQVGGKQKLLICVLQRMAQSASGGSVEQVGGMTTVLGGRAGMFNRMLQACSSPSPPQRV